MIPESGISGKKKEGILQTILEPAVNLGKDIAQFTPQFKEQKQAIEDSSKYIAETLKRTDISDRSKQIIANIADEVEPLKDIFAPRTPEQMIGDLAGTILLVATPASLLRGIGTGLIAQATRGAVTFGAIGAAGGLSEGEDVKGVLKSTAKGAVVGAITAPVLGLAGQGIVRSAKFVAEKAKPFIEKISESSMIRGLFSVAARLERFGEDGKEIVLKALTADRNKLLRTGQFMIEAEGSGMFNLSKEQRWSGKNSLLDRLEGRVSNESDDIGKAFEVADKARTGIATEAQQKGVKVRFRRGVARLFRPREFYFPHMGVSADDIENNTPIFKDAVENAIRLRKFADEKEARKVANAYLDFVNTNGKGGELWVKWLVKDGQTSAGKLTGPELNTLRAIEKGRKPPEGLQYDPETITKLRNAMDEARGMTLRFFQKTRLPKFGQLEYAREFDFPFYDPDPIRVLPKYVLGATERLEIIGQFGVKGEQLNRLLGRIRRVQGPEIGQEAAELVKVMTQSTKNLPAVEKASAVVRVLSVPKLAFSQIINIGQSVNSLLASDIPSIAKGISSAFTKAGVQNALKSGSTLDSVINEITTRYGESTFASKFLRYTGFSATEKFNRIVSANTGIFWTQKNFNRLLINPTDKVALGRLAELGIDVQKVLQAGKLSEQELLQAAQIFTERTQFRARPLDLPAFANSPYGKIFFQFKNFAYNQSKFLKNEFKRELQLGNYGRATRNIIILGTIFPMTGEVLRDVQSLITGTRRPTDALDRYFDDLGGAGGIGLAYDVVESASIGKLSSTILGPTLSSGVDISQIIIQAIKKNKLTDSQKRLLINQLGITRPIGNYVFQADRKDTETFFETLQDVFND